MNILITGIHGFVGNNLVVALKKQYVLYGLDIVSPPTEGVCETFRWDELESIPPVGMIVHLSGLAHDTKSTYDAKKYFDVNLGLTKLVFDYFLKSNANKFIFFSSVKAVADSLQDEILIEDSAPEPHTAYGKSKLEAERYIMSKSIPEGKNVYILRPCMIHGPGNKGNLNLLYNLIKTGLPYPLGAFENKRSFASIQNVNFIIEQIIERDITPGIYQVADDEALSTNEVITQISLALNKKNRIWKINQQLIKQIASLGDILHLPFNNERLRKLTENYVVSNNKLISELGVSLPISSREGLLHTIRSFSKNS